MSEIPGRESALSRELARVNCALVKIVDADDRYYVLEIGRASCRERV